MIERFVRASALAFLGAGFAAAALMSGCQKSSPTGTVQGKVLLGGQPYANAAVILLSKETGNGGTANLEKDGTFRISTPLRTGTYTAYLAPPVAAPSDQPVPVSMDRSVPAKYWSESSSDLQVKVAPGANDVTLELKK